MMDSHEVPDEPTNPLEESELQRAHADLEAALAQRDTAAMSAANKKIRQIREEIHAGRRALSSLAAERIHLVEVIERARLQLLRYERHLDDHDRKIEKLRRELRQLGARLPDHPGLPTLEPAYLSDEDVKGIVYPTARRVPSAEHAPDDEDVPDEQEEPGLDETEDHAHE